MLADYNFTALIIGPPRYGKTTVLRDLVREHLTTHPTGLALVHDPNRQLRSICKCYDDAAAWRRAFDRACATREPFCRGASIGGEGEAVREAAVTLGKQRNVAENCRIPMLLGFDESSLLEDSGSTHMGKADRALLSNRAHWGIGPVYNAQSVTALDKTFFSLATHVLVFAQVSETETTTLGKRIGIPPERLRGLVMAPKFRHIRWEAGKGLV